MGPPRLNEPSLLLTQEENGMVFSFLGNRCQVLYEFKVKNWN